MADKVKEPETMAERRALVERLRPLVARLLADWARAQRRRKPCPLSVVEVNLIKTYDAALADVTTYELARRSNNEPPRDSGADGRVVFEVPDNGRAANVEGWKGRECPGE